MKSEWRKFAPYGIYISLIAAFVALGFYIVQRSFNLPVQICLGIVVCGLAIFVLLDPQKTQKLLKGRQMQYGSNAIIMAFAFIGIFVVINFLVYKNEKRWDLTEEKEHTLSPETIDIIKNLSDPVFAQAFYSKSYPKDSAQKLLDTYKYQSNGKFNYEFIDPEANPIAAQAANITRDGTIVLQMGNRQDQVTYADEKEISSSLIKLANPGNRIVYFLTGHGEHNPDESGDDSYSQVKSSLETKNYSVKLLNLFTDHAIPQDALAIVIAGANKPLTDEEVSLIKTYIDQGGSIVYLSEPSIVTDFGDETDPFAAYLSQFWGIDLKEDLVIDPNANDPSVSIASTYGTHLITEKLMGLVTVFPTTRSVRPGIVPQEINQVVLVSTSNNTWAETDMVSIKNSQISPDTEKDFLGPVPIVIAASNNNNKSRIIVFGDSNFASNAYFLEYGNGDLIINAIDWTAKQDELINLTPKNTISRTIIAPQTYTIGLIFLGTVIIIPASVIIIGVMMWLQRKRRG